MSHDEMIRRRKLAAMGLPPAESTASNEPSSGEDIARRRRLANLKASSNEGAAEPAGDEQIISDGTIKALKTAGTLAAMAGRWTAAKTKEAAIVAAEKSNTMRAELEAKQAERKRLAATAEAEKATQDPERGESVVNAPTQPRRSLRVVGLVIGGALVLAVSGVGYWWSQRDAEPASAPFVVPPAPIAVPETQTATPSMVVPPAPLIPEAIVEADPVIETAPIAPVVMPEPAPAVAAEPTAPVNKAPQAKALPVPVRAAPQPKPKAKPVQPPTVKKPADWQDKVIDELDKSGELFNP